MPNAEIEHFLKTYYTSLTCPHTPTDHLDHAKLSISKETEEEKQYVPNLPRTFHTYHKKKIVKILVVSLNVISDTLLMVIGQYVYEDLEITRFIEVINHTHNKIISSTVRILDEEVNYVKDKRELMNTLVSMPKKCVYVKNGSRLSYKEVIASFGMFGKIVAYEKRGPDAYLEFDSYEAVDGMKASSGSLLEQGIEIDTYKHYEKRH